MCVIPAELGVTTRYVHVLADVDAGKLASITAANNDADVANCLIHGWGWRGWGWRGWG